MKNLENSALMYTIIGMIFAWGLMRDGTEQEINH